MKKKKYLIYNLGEKSLSSHLDAVHAQKPKSDQYTGEIVKSVIETINASGIIATISRSKMDLNRPRSPINAPAIDEYRETIKEIIESKGILDGREKLTKNYLHLAIHGMKNRKSAEFEIGTLNGASCSPQIIDWFMKRLKSISSKYALNRHYPGNKSKSYHRNGDPSSGYHGYGDKFHTIQIEINRTWRKTKQNELVKFLSEVITEFDREYN